MNRQEWFLSYLLSAGCIVILPSPHWALLVGAVLSFIGWAISTSKEETK